MTMKKLLLLAIVLNVVLHPFRAGASVIRFEALLTGDQEVPAVSTDASGMAILLLDDVQNRLEIFVQLFGLDLRRQTPDSDDDVRGMHIHRAPFGFDGPIVFGFIDPNSDLNGDLLIDPSPPCGAFLFPCGTVFSGWDMNEGLETTSRSSPSFLRTASTSTFTRQVIPMAKFAARSGSFRSQGRTCSWYSVLERSPGDGSRGKKETTLR